MTDRELYRLAKAALKNAYAPYSGFKVGAAVLTADGTVFTGANVENASYPAGICAERSAVAAAVSAGYRSFEAAAVTGEKKAAWPCGICRQFMFEFSPEMRIISGDDEDHLESFVLSEMLIKGFGKGSL